MSEPVPEPTDLSGLPEATCMPRKQRRLSVVWIIPLVAAVLGGWVAVQKMLSEGPTITISFHNAEGLEEGKTKVRYNGVDVGTVTTITLSPDRKRVIATAAMAAESRDMLVEDTQFWVVRPRISGGTVSGLGTLLSGSYIGMEVGQSMEKQHAFRALAAPPVVTGDVPGRFFILRADNLSSLDYGTPLFFRRIQVGQVVAYQLDQDGRTITANIFIHAPYDQYVTPATRFWQASGIDVSLAANGINIHTESLVSVLIGGIAFETPEIGPPLPPAEPNTAFTLFENRVLAMKPPEGAPRTFVLIFRQSVRGLVVGAPVEFSGIHFGEVVSIGLNLHPQTYDIAIPITIRIYPDMLFEKLTQGNSPTVRPDSQQIVDKFVELGFRGQLRTGNLITGALYIAFDIFPDAPRVKVDWSQQPVVLPTVPGELQEIEQSLMRIVRKLDQLPLEAIAGDLRKTLATLDQSLKDVGGLARRVTTEVAPEAKSALAEARRTLEAAERALSSADKAYLGQNAPVQQEFRDALQELTRAARSLRVLADYLDRHPESLLRGKQAGSP